MPQSAEASLQQILEALGGGLGGVRLGAPVSGAIPVSVSGTATVSLSGSPTMVPRGTGVTGSVSFTRPNNAAPAYSIKDVVGPAAAALQLDWLDAAGNPAPTGVDILITMASLEIRVAAVPPGMSSFTVRFYDVTPPSALADNAAWDLSAGDRAAHQGFIDGLIPNDDGSTLYDELKGVNKQIRLAAGSSSSYLYLITDAVYTPTALVVKKLVFHGVVL